MESSSPYLAGFFDGDGSLHFQIIRQKEYRFGFYIRASLVFYQSTPYLAGLEELKNMLGDAGYIRSRAGGMSDLTITNRQAIRQALERMRPYVIFKRPQVELGLACWTACHHPRTRSDSSRYASLSTTSHP